MKIFYWNLRYVIEGLREFVANRFFSAGERTPIVNNFFRKFFVEFCWFDSLTRFVAQNPSKNVRQIVGVVSLAPFRFDLAIASVLLFLRFSGTPRRFNFNR